MENSVALTKAVLYELKQIKTLLSTSKTVLNVEDLAQYTGLSKSKIYKLLSNKLIPTGNNENIRQKFFYKEEIDNWLMGYSEKSEELEREFNASLAKNRKL